MIKYIKELIRYKDFLGLLIQRDIKLKYRRSFLGYIWSVLNPLLTMIIMTIVFSKMFKRNIENFPVYLLIGNILFGFMRESSTLAMNSVVGNASLIKKIYVPRFIFTISTVTSSMINLLFAMGALIAVILFTGVNFTFYTLLIIIPITELYIFCIGLGLFLAQASVFFRDIRNIWSVITLAWMYMTPIFYPLSALPEMLQVWIPRLNPMYIYITQFRDFVLTGAGTNPMLLLKGLIFAVAMLFVGIWRFRRNENRFILYI